VQILQILRVIVLSGAFLAGPSVADNARPQPLGIPLGADRKVVESIFEKAQIKTIGANPEGGFLGYKRAPKSIEDGGEILLHFHKDKLARIALTIKIESQQAHPYISRYESLKANLTKKYGKPDRDIENMDSTYSDHPLLAIKTGKSQRLCGWKKDNLFVLLGLMGDNFKVNFTLAYAYLPLWDEYTQEQEDEEASNL